MKPTVAIIALLATFTRALIMRNINGECFATVCWDGSEIDPFDCWCPDPPTDTDGGSSGGSSGPVAPSCKQ